MSIAYKLVLAGLMCFVSSVSFAQDMVPYPESKVAADWRRGTDFSRYKTYAWSTSYAKTVTPQWDEYLIKKIDSQLLAKGLQKVATGTNPDLIISYGFGSKIEYSIQHYPGNNVFKEGTLVVQLVDAKTKQPVWWCILEDVVTGKSDKDFATADKKIAQAFRKYPPSTR